MHTDNDRNIGTQALALIDDVPFAGKLPSATRQPGRCSGGRTQTQEIRMDRALSLLLIAACLSCASAIAQDRTERLNLDSGAVSVKGKIKGNDSVQYSFSAKAHQQLSIKLRTSNPSNYINVERDGSAEAVCQGALTGNVCAVRPESATNYVVDVFLMRNAARRGETAEYTLLVEPGDGASAQPAGTSAQPAGTSAQPAGASQEAAASAVAACKSALALKSGQNAVFVLPLSHVPAAGGFEVFLSLKGAQWLCTTDPRGNVNRLEQR